MTTYSPQAKTLELPWPFTGRQAELGLIRRSLAGGRHGIVVTGPAGCGRTRLVTEAVRGTDCARVTGLPDSAGLPFAAFAPLLPETVSLHRAVQLLSGRRLLVVDDAHLLDEASAALVHQLAAHGRTRLIVVATDGEPVPGAVSRLWTGELLPRLALEPLPREETAQLLALGTPLDPLTVNRLHRVCRGDLRLLRDLLGVLRESGPLTRVPETGEWAWRGPVPVTATVRERMAPALDRSGPGERDTLERLAFAEPLPLRLDDLDLDVLERLEADGLLHLDDHGAVRLAHPLHGPVLRATAGRLRARRLARTPQRCGPALSAERRALAGRIEGMDVRPLPTPVGEWLAAEGAPVPPDYAAVRARFSRLRGELREAAAWAREGLREAPGDASCRAELALAAAQSGEVALTGTDARAGDAASVGDGAGFDAVVPVGGDAGVGAVVSVGGDAGVGAVVSVGGGVGVDAGVSVGGDAGVGAVVSVGGGVGVDAGVSVSEDAGVDARVSVGGGAGLDADVSVGGGAVPSRSRPSADGTAVWAAAARGDLDGALRALAGDGPYALYDAVRLGVPERAADRLADGGVLSRHAKALLTGDGPALDRAARALEERGFLLFAAEAYAQAVRAHRDPRAARTSRTRAVALARRCQGARTPALSGLVLGELTARQRQIVTLAAAGLSNREIAERLTLSIRTVGNHLYSAYARLGASDRGALPWLVELPDTASA